MNYHAQILPGELNFICLRLQLISEIPTRYEVDIISCDVNAVEDADFVGKITTLHAGCTELASHITSLWVTQNQSGEQEFLFLSTYLLEWE